MCLAFTSFSALPLLLSGAIKCLFCVSGLSVGVWVSGSGSGCLGANGSHSLFFTLSVALTLRLWSVLPLTHRKTPTDAFYTL